MNVDWQKIINHYKLFWQYPVCTEKQFYLQNKQFRNYIGFPWATILDKGVDINQVAKIMAPFINQGVEYYTCCQHIRFRELKELFKFLNIKTVYTPHKCIDEESIDDIGLLPCPLYAVNFEDDSRNGIFKNKDFLNLERKYSFSFMGGLQPGYLSDIRERIFDTDAPDDVYIENTGGWHFNSLVYTEKQNFKKDLNLTPEHENKTDKYNKVLINSRFSLCPSGTGPSSIRFWESLAVGSIPVLLSDTLELPKHKLWDEAILRVEESKYENIFDIIKNIDPEEEKKRRINCLKIYDYFCNNYADISIKPLIHYCCGSYYQNNFGGVACYDHQLSKAFQHREFFEGPAEKEKMIEFLKDCEDPIVITDNHLSCDIPNQYKTFIVHHGVAMTHAIREPSWDLYWKNLCCSGQNRMLYYRNPKNTEFISTSKFCTDEFINHYGEEYKKFTRHSILHASEFDESKTKITWNNSPVVLGNWSTDNKGKSLIEFIQNKTTLFEFNNLNVYPQGNIRDFIDKKQDMYLNSDIFLQLSLSEGNSYATLDAMLCGIPVVASNVGLFYKDVPEDCFVKVDWQKNDDIDYVLEKLEYAWKNKEKLSKNAKMWYINNCSFKNWNEKMHSLILSENHNE